MLVLLSCAKTMNTPSGVDIPFTTIPRFQAEATEIALQMSQFSVQELEKLLHVNAKIAVDNYKRFQEFPSASVAEIPAVLRYTGMVFKKLHPADFTKDDFMYAQSHLLITSFGYGLLRPLDAIRPYRLEGNVRLPEFGDQTLFAYWKPLLTDLFINQIKSTGGILCNLASEEMKNLFDWNKVEKQVRVITPEFKVWKNDKLTSIVIYTKMSRGEMTRFILKNRLQDPEALKSFSWEGFTYQEELSDSNKFIFVNG